MEAELYGKREGYRMSDINGVKEDITSALGGFSKLYSLSKRENDILELLVNKVVSAEAIANRLGISKNTVRIHFQNIFNKMSASSKSEVLGKFIEYVIEGSYLKSKAEVDRKLTIVVVDDDKSYKELIQRALGKLLDNGIDYVELANGKELLEYVFEKSLSGQVSRPDLILLDLNMPVINGFDALAQLKGQVDSRDIPIVVFTTSDEPADVKKIYELGGNSFVTKPTGFRALVDVMNGILSYWCEIGALPETKEGGSDTDGNSVAEEENE